MKKSLKRSIALAMSSIFMASASVAFAAEVANPFNDVPASHWAYNSVKQLAKAGIIEGANGNSFKGDQVITRYEMATIVAKSMTKYNTADAATKAQIDKLKVEFADELNNLGVRMQKVEQKVDNAPQIHGLIKTFYDYSKNDSTKASNLYQDVRINISGKIDDTWSYRLDYLYTPNTNQVGGATNDFRSVNTTPPAMASNGAALFANNIFHSKTTAVLGFQWVGPVNDNWVYSNGLKGVSLYSQIGGVNVSARHGELDLIYNHGFSYDNNATILTAGKKVGNTDIGVAYWDIKDNTNNFTFKVAEAQIKQPLGKNVLLNINAGRSNDGDDKDQKQFYDIKVSYKDTDLSKPGSYSLYADYHSIGANSTFGPDEASANAKATGLKGVRIGYNFVPFKGTIWRNYVMPNNKLISDDKVETTIFRSMMFVEF